MNLHEAAQRLLQAINAALPYAPHRSEFDVVADAADDLRAALNLDQELNTTKKPVWVQGLPKQFVPRSPIQPVAWQWLNTGTFRKKLPKGAEAGAWNPLYTNPALQRQKPQDEPVQEPVAWIHEDQLPEGYPYDAMWPYSQIRWGTRMFPVYTAQPKRKPLTEKAMRECAQAMDAEPLAEGWPELIKFARAIERAHGIGRQDESA